MELSFSDTCCGVFLADGRSVLFPRLKEGGSHFEESKRLTLKRNSWDYELTDAADGRSYRFVNARSTKPDAPLPLVEVRDRNGSSLHLEYDARGRLSRIVDSAYNAWEFESDVAGHITQISGPDPQDKARRLVHVRYRYDRSGNLVEVRDALGQAQRRAVAVEEAVRRVPRSPRGPEGRAAGSTRPARARAIAATRAPRASTATARRWCCSRDAVAVARAHRTSSRPPA